MVHVLYHTTGCIGGTDLLLVNWQKAENELFVLPQAGTPEYRGTSSRLSNLQHSNFGKGWFLATEGLCSARNSHDRKSYKKFAIPPNWARLDTLVQKKTKLIFSFLPESIACATI